MIYKGQNKGFTLLEIIVALAIFMTGLLGIFSLVLQSLRAQNVNHNYLTASMLAQEAAEIIRNKRDYNWLKFSYNKWQTGDILGSETDILQDNNYTVSYDGTVDDTAGNISDPEAKLYLNSGFYDHDNGGLITPFSRLVTINDSNDDMIDLEIKVEWQEKSITKDYEINMRLYNWR